MKQETEPFRGPDGEYVADSIAEAAYEWIGGVDQWVMIRGENIANPPLIMLHGGPGLSETALFRRFNAPLEHHFTVVYWDQRGAGRSLTRGGGSRAGLTVAQLLEDLDELVDLVCARVGQPQVVLFGHSWGSALGVLYAARLPHKVAAYVGSGQIGDWATAETASYAYALTAAQRRGDRWALRKLLGIGPPPYDADAVWTERTCLSHLEGRLRPTALWHLGRIMLGAPESSLGDAIRNMRAFPKTLGAMWPEVSQLSLIALAPTLHVPVFFFLGRHDHWVPPETSLAYYAILDAPVKRLVWFEGSGHEPFMDEPRTFNSAMIDLVRPYSIERTAAELPSRPETASQPARP